MDDYITVLAAAAEINMSPASFANLLRRSRDVLPLEINYKALAKNAFILSPSKALEGFYQGGEKASISLELLKIHLLDWKAYLANLEPSSSTENSKAKLLVVHIPRNLWAGKTAEAIFTELSKQGKAPEVIAAVISKVDGITKTAAGRLFHKEDIDKGIVHDPTTYQRTFNRLLKEFNSKYTLTF